MSSTNARVSKAESLNAPGSNNVWEKWYWMAHYALYGLLALTTLLALFSGDPAWRVRALEVAVAGLFAGWHWYFQGRSPGWFYSHLGIRISYVVGIMAFFVVLASLSDQYWLLAFIVYWQAWTIASVASSAVLLVAFTLFLLGIQGVGFAGAEGFLNLGLVGVATAVSIVMGLFISSLISQSEERQRLIKELESTRAELADEESRAGILEERGRLAREIHDTLAQGFISIVTHLEAAEESNGSKESRRHVEQAKQTSRENLAEARRLVAALRPEILENYSLPEALRRLTTRTSEDIGVPVELDVTGDPDETPQELQVTLLRAAQEALANVRRHANAGRVDLTLSYAGELLLLDIQDDGSGFDPSACSSNGEGGFGLHSMRERVETLGGKLLVESEPGGGTTLAVQLPLRSAEAVESVRDSVNS